jgi:putative transposon-encoded protein
MYIYMDNCGLDKEGIKGLNELNKRIIEINNIMKALNVPEDIIEKEVKPFGNASHIILPKEYKSRKAKVIIRR